jgi:hypothetical protein
MSFLNPPQAEVRRRRLMIGGASLLITGTVVVMFLIESRYGYSKPDPRLIFVQSWSADRTRADTLADRAATKAAQEAKLAESRRYIATLTGKKKADAQGQYDEYVKGGGADKDIPYVPARPPVTVVQAGEVPVL